MAWSYEVRGDRDRLVEVRSGFATEDEACDAGKRAKRLIDCVCYPNLERLTIQTLKGGDNISQLAEMPHAPEEWFEPSLTGGQAMLRYPWQQLVLDAFMESRPEHVFLKINVAERSIAIRLVDAATFALDERLALGEGLLALRRLLSYFISSTEFREPGAKTGIG